VYAKLVYIVNFRSAYDSRMMMMVVVTTVTVEHSESVVGKHCIGHVSQFLKKKLPASWVG